MTYSLLRKPTRQLLQGGFLLGSFSAACLSCGGNTPAAQLAAGEVTEARPEQTNSATPAQAGTPSAMPSNPTGAPPTSSVSPTSSGNSSNQSASDLAPPVSSGAPTPTQNQPTLTAPGSKSSATTTPTQPACPSNMVLVPGGEYERAGNKEVISALCVDILETTAAEYAACVAQGKCTEDGLGCSAQSTYKQAGKENHPINCVQFIQADNYCRQMGKRLPTTAEWEWAARGGEEAREYPWGNEAPSDQLCWTGKSKQTETCAVGSYPGGASRDGIKDMAGNVLEFTTTPIDKKSPVRIARGGSWNVGDPPLFRSSRIGGFALSYRCGFLGIRCVVEPQSDSK